MAYPSPWVSAVVVAAGASTRMTIGGKHQSKQLLTLCGVPLLARTVAAIGRTKAIREWILVIKKEEEQAVQALLSQYCPEIACTLVYGGNTRQQSVQNGIFAADSRAEYFVIHDGARPLVTTEEINRVLSAAYVKRAATLGVPVKDTIKKADVEGKILSTPDRSTLWAVHTPQVFEKELYLAALKKAIAEKKDYTDDCQLVESLGCPVWIVEGKYTNLKITTADDLLLAEAILRSRCAHGNNNEKG